MGNITNNMYIKYNVLDKQLAHFLFRVANCVGSLYIRILILRTQIHQSVDLIYRIHFLGFCRIVLVNATPSLYSLIDHHCSLSLSLLLVELGRRGQL